MPGGADVGVGMLVPFLGRSADERCAIIRAIVPFFLVNEVRLAATAGVLVGAFPALQGQLLSGLLPIVAALLAGWAVRDMGLWLRDPATSPGRRVLCHAVRLRLLCSCTPPC